MDGMFLHLFKPVVLSVHPCVLEEVRHSVQKERRIIDTLEPVMARHKLVVTPEVIEEDYRTAHNAVREMDGKSKEAYSLFHQMTRITHDKGCLNHDDRLDALAIAVGYFTERLARDVDKEINHMRSAAMDKLLRDKYARANRNVKTVGSDLTWSNRISNNSPNILSMR